MIKIILIIIGSLLLLLFSNYLGGKMEAVKISLKADAVIADLKKVVLEADKHENAVYRKGVIDASEATIKSLNQHFQNGKKEVPFTPMRNKTKKNKK